MATPTISDRNNKSEIIGAAVEAIDYHAATAARLRSERNAAGILAALAMALLLLR